MASAILFSGSSPAKVISMCRTMNLQMFSARTYMRMQSSYLIPAIFDRWDDQHHDIVHPLQGRPLIVGGDARCDSPGYSAKYSSYTIMDLETSKILDVQLIQVIIVWLIIYFAGDIYLSIEHRRQRFQLVAG
jgi:hypothetical protein